MSGITTHILDISAGRPASGVPVKLEFRSKSAGWEEVGRGETDADGRTADLISSKVSFVPGHYRLTFETAVYFLSQEIQAFYPQVEVIFTVRDVNQKYHVPLLLSPFGYSTYRGS